MAIGYHGVADVPTNDQRATVRQRESDSGRSGAWSGPQHPVSASHERPAPRLRPAVRPHPAADDICDRAIGAVELRAGFRALARTDRDLLYLYYVDDVPIAELSRRLNTSDSAIHQRLVRARSSLRRQVEIGIGRLLRRRWQARKAHSHA
ncbi:RNA polymerase sigma factor [Catellatospora methionotrophica]|uniref:RNA polymerase sigma factor n=1 Tax=Catellatospora methionotrophica TaxID=121620 RepID=UPI0033FF2FCE